jgi:hypothetical protein
MPRSRAVAATAAIRSENNGSRIDPQSEPSYALALPHVPSARPFDQLDTNALERLALDDVIARQRGLEAVVACPAEQVQDQPGASRRTGDAAADPAARGERPPRLDTPAIASSALTPIR